MHLEIFPSDVRVVIQYETRTVDVVGVNVIRGVNFNGSEADFNAANYVEGICAVITTVGQTLAKEFPYKPKDDKNELPDEIVFGK